METIGKLIGIIIIMACGFFTFKNFENYAEPVKDFLLTTLATIGIFTLLPLAIAFAKALTE